MTAWLEGDAPAKLNLALVVGPLRPDGMHEVVTVMERLALADLVAVRRAESARVTGFADDTLVADALDGIARSAGSGATAYEARIVKRIPVAAGLGGGSSDAATALRLANELLDEPLHGDALERLAGSVGADVPFFLHAGPQLATGDGTTLEPIRVPRDYSVVLALPRGVVKTSTAEVYAAFDARHGAAGFDERRTALVAALEGIEGREGLARLPANDLASAPLAGALRALGAFRADVTGAGPAVYGLFGDARDAERAAAAIGAAAATWVTTPA
jgi:4-diphosphocytidyl-2-C-methyl-D-erythritol kinase